MTLRDQPCYSELSHDLKTFARGRRLVEIVNTGNWGDALIHAGQAQFLKDIGIEPWQFSISRLLRMRRDKFWILSRVLSRRAFVTGHGAYTDWYARPKEISQVAGQFSQVLLMPSSYPMFPELDKKRTIVWRRDNLESVQTVPNSKFCHDLAFYLSPKSRKPSKKIGLLFRSDKEMGAFQVPEHNRDISSEGTHASDPDIFFDLVGEYEIILTNRLHVGIAGSLLGRTVHLFDSKTQKIKSIFESSIKPFYENVHYHPEPPSTDFIRQL